MANSQKPSDMELLSVLGAGASGAAVEAEGELVERYSVLVKKIARPLFLSGWSSEDMFQEGMVGLLMAIRSYSPEKSPAFGAYAETCVRNRLYSAVRRGLGSGSRPLQDYVSINARSDDGDLTVDVPDDTDFLNDIIVRDEINRLVGYLESAATPLERRVLDGYLRGLSIREVAQSIGKDPKACENAIYRIRKKAEAFRSAEK